MLMQDARKFAKIVRQKHHLSERKVMFVVRKKMLENAAAQQDTLQKAAETKKKEIIKAVIAHDGPFTTAADVHRLQKTLNTKEFFAALKNEIRYQMLILALL